MYKFSKEDLNELDAAMEDLVEFYNTKIYEKLYTYYTDLNEMPYGVAKARTGDPDQWIWKQLHKEGIVV